MSAPDSGWAPTRTPDAVSPRNYTPRHLAEKILANRDALGGERKQVTVLFADIVGSTDLIRDLDAEDAQQLLDGALQRMMDAVHRYEGTVSRLLGDGLMALFGAPIAHEDHAVRACYAGLAMQQAIRQYAEEVRQRHGVPVEARIGLNSGEVVVRLISDDLHLDYTAMGQTVHIASRMEQLARAGTILLSASTLALVEGFLEVRALAPVPVKGLPGPVDVYELVGVGAARTRLQAAAARGLTRFVGRTAELGVLHTALERAAASHGQLAALVGEPGVGKSRLVWEVTHSHRTAGWTVLESGSVSHGKATAYLPIVDLLKAYCRIEARDDNRTVREKVIGKLLTLDRALESVLTPLLVLLDVPVDDAAWEELEPPQRRRATLDALRRVLLRESREQPLLLVFEDLHWIDSETQAVLDSLVDSLPTARILLLVNYRPEYRHQWGNRGYYAQLRIDPLSAESADELLDALLGEHLSTVSLRSLLVERTEGNPFFLEECIRMLVDSGVLAGERGAYRLDRDLATIQVPATVQAILAARVDCLPPEQKRLLQTAAAIGKDVPETLLRTVTGLSADDLSHQMAALQAAEFLYEASLFPELEYTFKHALTHEVTYGSLLQERRRGLHAQIMTAIEQRYADRLAEQVERLAHHAGRGECWEQAATYSRQAGARASERLANREALVHFEHALVALRHLPDGPETRGRIVDVQIDLRQVLWLLGQVQPSLDVLREAEALAIALGDARHVARIQAILVRVLWTIGDNDGAIESAEQAEAAGEALGDDSIQIPAIYHLAFALASRGDFRGAIAAQERVMAALSGDRMQERFGLASRPAVSGRAVRAWCLAELGETRLAAAAAEETVRLADETGHTYTLTQALVYVADCYVVLGQAEAAVSLIEHLEDRSARQADDSPHPLTWPRLGAAHALAGRHAQALSFREPMATGAEAAGRLGAMMPAIVCLGETYRLAGRAADASAQAWRAVELARERRLRPAEAAALELLGTLAAETQPPDLDGAERWYRQALSIAEELGMRPLQARCRLGLGKLNRRAGRAEQAHAELSRAVAMLREMELSHWLQEAEGELAAASAAPVT